MNATNCPVLAMTGSTGLIGRRLVSRLGSDGVALRLLVRQSTNIPPGAVPVPGELSDEASLRELVRGASALVHLAGIAHTTFRTEDESQQAREVNVGGTVRLFKAARQEGVRKVIFVSSAHVYRRQEGTNLSETSMTAADSPYARMKLDAETAAHAAAASGMHVVLVRPCLVYGPGVRFNLAMLLRAIRRRRYIHAGSVSPLRSLASVDTVAASIAHLLHRGESGATYNLADRTPVRLHAWVDSLADRMGVAHPRKVPLSLLRPLAVVLTPAAQLGLPAPLTLDILRKLTESFSLDVSALANTGFVWPDTVDSVLDEMVVSSE